MSSLPRTAGSINADALERRALKDFRTAVYEKRYNAADYLRLILTDGGERKYTEDWLSARLVPPKPLVRYEITRQIYAFMKDVRKLPEGGKASWKFEINTLIKMEDYTWLDETLVKIMNWLCGDGFESTKYNAKLSCEESGYDETDDTSAQKYSYTLEVEFTDRYDTAEYVMEMIDDGRI